MDTFTQNILDKLNILRREGLEKIKLELLREFGPFLPYDYQQRHKFLSNFSVAFLMLYKENASMLLESYIETLQDNLSECYQHAEDEHLKSLTVEDDLSIHSIDFPNKENQSEWSINYEMDLDDTIFHVYFEGWRFKTIIQTH